VGVIGISEPGRAPLALPIWYSYEPGGNVSVLTGEKSAKAKLLRAAMRYTLTAQIESFPYQYVSVEGPIVLTRPADREADLRPLARRYMGEAGGDEFVAQYSTGDPNTVFEMRPEHWRTVDYSQIVSP
jgi:hypothetical protein